MIRGDGTKLVKAMQQIASIPMTNEVGVVIGKVISTSPLKIQVEKLVLTEEFLILSAFVKRTVISVPAVDVSTYREDDTHRHAIAELTTSTNLDHSHTIPAHYTSYDLPEICLWRGLEVNDYVYMLRMNNGQRYFVLQREEGIT